MGDAALHTSVGEPVTYWVTLRLNGETYGVSVMQVQEVVQLGELAPVAGAPRYGLGAMAWRGRRLSVIDARACLGLPGAAPDEASRVVIVGAVPRVAGFLVDSALEVIELRQSEIDSSPVSDGPERSNWFHGRVGSAEGQIRLLDMHRLLSEEQWSELTVL